jgi:hypothetical protein
MEKEYIAGIERETSYSFGLIIFDHSERRPATAAAPPGPAGHRTRLGAERGGGPSRRRGRRHSGSGGAAGPAATVPASRGPARLPPLAGTIRRNDYVRNENDVWPLTALTRLSNVTW